MKFSRIIHTLCVFAIQAHSGIKDVDKRMRQQLLSGILILLTAFAGLLGFVMIPGYLITNEALLSLIFYDTLIAVLLLSLSYVMSRNQFFLLPAVIATFVCILAPFIASFALVNMQHFMIGGVFVANMLLNCRWCLAATFLNIILTLFFPILSSAVSFSENLLTLSFNTMLPALFIASQYYKLFMDKRRTQTINNHETLLAKFLHEVPIGVYILKEDASPFFINDAGRKILGSNADQWQDLSQIGEAANAFKRGYAQPYPVAEMPIVKALAGESSSVEDMVIIQADGRHIPLLVQGIPIYDNNGQLSHALALFQDISERINWERQILFAKQEAESASKLKSIFLANMSHEIRTPLNAIIGYTELLQDFDLSQNQLEYTKIIRNSGELLLNIINDVLDMSKIEAGQLRMHNTIFSLIEVIRQAEANAYITLAKKSESIDLSLVLDENIAQYIECDPYRLLQILNNLLSNACKFTSDGSIQLVVSQQLDNLEFQIIDTGIGIEPLKLNQIFRPFQQLQNDKGGTGLGLSITKKLVELMGGNISVNSNMGKMHGTKVTFTIPYRPRYSPANAPAKSKDTMERKKAISSAKGKRILIVEDNAVNLQLTQKILSKNGYTTEPARNGIEAIVKYKTLPDIQLILMDVHMPHLDGKAATREIRAYEKNQPLNFSVPIIALTASAMSQEKIECLQSGFNDFLTKPINQAILIATIEKYI